MKALLVTKNAAPEGDSTISYADMRSLRASLDAMGISHKRARSDQMPSDAYINEFDFIVIPTFASGFVNLVDSATITIPIIGLNATAGVAGFGTTTTGVSGSRTNYADDFYTASWTTSEYLALYSSCYTALTANGTALLTMSANEPAATGGGAQPNAGKIAAWKNPTASGNTLYISCAHPNNHAMLPFLLQEAINDGKVTGPTPRKAPICVDLDHINGQYVHADPTILDKIASYVPTGGVMWAGIQNSSTTYFQNMTDAVKTKLQAYENAPFKYCWHDHIWVAGVAGLIGENLDADGYSTDHSKADQDAIYQSDKTDWEALGLTFNEDSFYYNSGSNSWDNASIELYSPDLSKVSSSGNDTVQRGYGCVAFRGIENANISKKLGARASLKHNQLHMKRKFRGIVFFHTYDMAENVNDMPYNAIADWRKLFNYYTNAVSYCQTLYFHDEDFQSAAQNPGTTQHGYVAMDLLSDMGKYLKDVSQPFADIGKLIPKVNYR